MIDYIKIHNTIIDRALNRDWRSHKHKKGKIEVNFPVEGHHIIPKSLGGSNSKKNIAVLSLKEHFIIHFILTKIYPTEPSLTRAFIIMCNRTKGKTANDYVLQKTRYREVQSDLSKAVWTPEMKSRARDRMLQMSKDPDYISKVSAGVKKAYQTTDLRHKVSEAAKSNWENSKYREKVSEGLRTYWTDENREKAAESTKEQNKKNPKLAEIRSNAIKDHQESKSKEWSERAGKWMSDWYSLPGNETVLSDRYFEAGSKFNNSRIVINIETGEEYRSLKYASEVLNINYNTLKKYIYNNNMKCPVRFKEDSNENE